MAYEIKFTIENDMLATVVSVLHTHVTAMSIAPVANEPDVAALAAPAKSTHKAKRGTLMSLVLATVRSRKRVVFADIYEAVEKRGLHGASVSSALSKLVAKGLVVRDAHGRYSAVAEATAGVAAGVAAVDDHPVLEAQH